MSVAVVDASIAIKWYIEEPGAEAASEVLEQIVRRARDFVVPELFFFEVTAVLMRRHPDPEDFIHTDMPFLLALPLTRIPMNASLATGIPPLVGRGLSGYDAAYAALAQQLQGDWITFDRRAAQALGSPPWIQLLA